MVPLIEIDWFAPVFTRFECARYVADRLVAVRHPDKNDADVLHWLYYMHVNSPDSVKFLHDTFKPTTYDMYVSGVAFDWKSFTDTFGYQPSYLNRHGFSAWNNDILKPNAYDYIIGADIVFDIDRHAGVGLGASGRSALRIVDYLTAQGINGYHTVFSGNGGYHVVIEHGEALFGDYGVEQTGETVKALSYCAVSVAGKILDIVFDEPYVDQGAKGRSYDDVDIHFKPMLPMAVRKAGYSLTSHGTVSLPVGIRELESVADVSYYRPRNVLSSYRLKGRGWCGL